MIQFDLAYGFDGNVFFPFDIFNTTQIGIKLVMQKFVIIEYWRTHGEQSNAMMHHIVDLYMIVLNEVIILRSFVDIGHAN